MHTPAHVAHHTPGRIRLEIPSHRGDGTFFATLARQIGQAGQVRGARGNPASASLVVDYAGPLEALLAEFARCQLALDSKTSGGAAVAARALPGWRIDPMLMASAAFGVVGVVQTLRGEVFMPAMTAFWYAASALRLAQQPAVAGSQAEEM